MARDSGKSKAQREREGYIRGLQDAEYKTQSDPSQMLGDPRRAVGYSEGYNDGRASRKRRGFKR